MSPALFAHPEWVEPLIGVVLGAAVLLAGARLVARRRRRRLLGPAASPDGTGLGGDLALLGAVLAVAVALAAPRFGERELRVPASGVDVVFALDVSRSMDARDVPPSRLDRARRNLARMLERLREADRAALVAFAGRGVLLAPLTPDLQALRELASGLDSDLIRPRSSHLAAGLDAALGAFEAGSERPRVVFVLSDGEDPLRREVEVAEAARRHVRVLTAAIGSDAGATLSDHGTPLVDRSGRVVVSRRDRERLRAVAEATGGAFFEADRFGRIDAERAVAAIRRDTGSGPEDTVVRRVAAVQVAPFAALAFALLLLEALPAARRSAATVGGFAATVGGFAARVGGVLVALALAGVAPVCAPARAQPAPAPPSSAPPRAPSASPSEIEDALRERPGDPALLNALGIARLERGRRAAASRAFLAASLAAPGPDTSATALFNLGVASLEAGELEAARDAFFDALALAPDDGRARFNLEWTLRALDAQPPPSGGGSEEDETPPDPSEAPEERERAEREELPEARDESRRPPAPVDPERLERRLDRVEDDPGAALRAASRAQDGRSRRTGEPEW